MGWAIAVHCGAGDIPLDLPAEQRESRKACLRHYLDIGVAALKAGRSPLDIVELVVCEIENSRLFNAGRGSCLTTDSTVEMEAAIMDGKTKNCGAVCGLKTVVNPISLARLVMEKTPHIFLAFDGAEAFARGQGVQTIEPSQFITPESIAKLKQVKEAYPVQCAQRVQKEELLETHTVTNDSQLGTVGCVVVDGNGNMAAATSTGGAPNKMVGRIGDTPIIGAGTYANSLCAVSATGRGDDILRGTIAREVAAVMEYKDLPLKEAAAYVLEKFPARGGIGLTAVSATGDITMPFDTLGMYRACETEDGYCEIAIH